MSNTIEEGLEKIRESVDEALEPKHIPAGKVRPVDRNILRLHMLGAKDDEIAKELGVSRFVISAKLKNPIIKRELERLDILTDKELIKLTMASKRRMLEAGLTAADALVSFMSDASTQGLQLKAIIKVLEYAHGKPRQSIAISPDVEKPLEDEDENLLDEMIDDSEKDEVDEGE